MSRKWIAPLLIVMMFVCSIAVVGRLPERVPTHWGLDGEVDGWMTPWKAVLFGPGIALANWLLFLVLPRIDPRREQYERFWPTYYLMVNGITLFLAVVQGLILTSALGWAVDVTRVILLLTGGLFLVVGNYLPRVRSNWWLGIRTPWTLSSEHVWRETHRFGGWTMMAAGALAMIAAFLPTPIGAGVAVAVMLGGGLIPVGYSYLLWKREVGR